MFREMLDAKREFHHAQRRYPIGAEVIGKDQTHFRVWAPRVREIDVVLEDGAGSKPIFYALTSEPGGYFSGAGNTGAGSHYRFRVNAGENFYPDPASRFQPEGPHGPSCVINPRQFRWADTNWPGPALAGLKGQIIYEMHIGTFTKQGTWRAAAEQLPELARIGITVIEMMPVAEFPGKFGWGYDGVNLFAPSHLYGTPDDLRAFIARAHSLGLAVILDVVYNHFGPDGYYQTIIWFAKRETNGGMRSTSMDRIRDPSGSSSSRTGVTGLRNFSSTDSVSTRRMPSAIKPTNTLSARLDVLRARQPARAQSF